MAEPQPGRCVHGAMLTRACPHCEHNDAMDAIVDRLDQLIRVLSAPRTVRVSYNRVAPDGQIAIVIPGVDLHGVEQVSADTLLDHMGVEIEYR